MVEYDSSTLTGSAAERSQTIDANHTSMCKFASREDSGYESVWGELKPFVLTEVRQPQESESLNEER